MTAAVVASLITVGVTVFGAVVMLLMVNYLPDSPFTAYFNSAGSFWVFCRGLAWFLPVSDMLGVLEVWIVVMFEIVVFKVVYELIGKCIGSG